MEKEKNNYKVEGINLIQPKTPLETENSEKKGIEKEEKSQPAEREEKHLVSDKPER